MCVCVRAGLSSATGCEAEAAMIQPKSALTSQILAVSSRPVGTSTGYILINRCHGVAAGSRPGTRKHTCVFKDSNRVK